MTTIADLPEFDPYSAEHLADPLASLEAARERSWAARSMRGLEIFTYEGCSESYGNESIRPGVKVLLDAMGLDAELMAGPGRTLTFTDGSEHRLLRGIVSKWFTPRRVSEMQADVTALVRGLLAPMTRDGGGDLADVVTRRIPGPVFCWMVGSDVAHADRLFDLSEILLEAFSGDPSLVERISVASEQMTAFVEDLIEVKRAAPGDDLMTIMLKAAETHDDVTLDDVHSLAYEMLTASTDNTHNSAALMMHLLAQHEDQWAIVRDDKSVVGRAVEECMRFDPSVREDLRVATDDTTLLDLEVPAGTVIWHAIWAAHNDPAIYPDPHTFDVTRNHARPQLVFGLGRHYCLGAALARMEMNAMLSVVRDTWKGFEIAGEPVIDRSFGAKVKALPLSVVPA